MKAISIYQPWATWIIMGYKTIETRKHDRFKGLVGQTIAIHAGKKYDINAWETAWTENSELYSNLSRCASTAAKSRGVIIGTVKVIGARWLDPRDSESALCPCSGLFGLILSDPVELNKPIPYKGQQGIFNVPDELTIKVQETV